LATERVERRLAAILAADVAGYSRLMGADEEGTHERLKAHLRELVDPKIKEHRGRIVKNTGDGMLAEFPSVVDAVRCAVEVQRAMADRNVEAPEDKRITFRIGINLGDVIAEEDDIYGDGVNVAARLEALAEPGGICVSRVVRDQIRDKLSYPFEDRGEQSVKNIARSVRVYALRPETVAELPAASLLDRTPPRDLVKLLIDACEVIARPEIRKLMARLIGSVPDYPMLLEVYRDTYYLPRRLAFVSALERVQAAGLLARNIDLETLADMLSGALMYHLLMPPVGGNPVGELRDHMIRLLRQSGFKVPR
jgi:class 3 adenylate cyclase